MRSQSPALKSEPQPRLVGELHAQFAESAKLETAMTANLRGWVMAGEPIIFRVHTIQRMAERGISVEDVRRILETGEVIEDYPNDFPYPSSLVLGWIGGRAMHVVAATTPDEKIVITVYEPDPVRWEPDLKRRKP